MGRKWSAGVALLGRVLRAVGAVVVGDEWTTTRTLSSTKGVRGAGGLRAASSGDESAVSGKAKKNKTKEA